MTKNVKHPAHSRPELAYMDETRTEVSGGAGSAIAMTAKSLSHSAKKMVLSSPPTFHYTKDLLNPTVDETLALINGKVKTLSDQGRLKDALIVLHNMDCQGISVGHHTYVSLLHCCIIMKAVSQGKLLHAHIIQVGLQCQNISISNKMVTMYAKSGCLDDAEKILHDIPQQNVVSWNVMIAACTREGHAGKALRLFYEMRRTGIQPDQFTLSSVLPACTKLESLEDGKEIHEEALRRGFQFNVFVGSTLVDMYVKCGSLDDARKVFDKMPERNVVTWTSMVAGYSHHGDLQEALRLFEQMPQRNALSWNAMMVGYAQKGLVDEAMDFFWRMPERDVVSWTAIIAGCAQNGCHEKALKLFFQMHQLGIKQNQFTFASVLPAWAKLENFEHAKEIHEEVIRHGFESNVIVASALVDMYIKCGSTEYARKVLDKMPERDVIAWTAMITGYAQSGDVDEALKLFQEMPKRNIVTWNAMIVGYTQNGYLDEAMIFFQSMPERDLFSWTAMVQGYAQHGHVDKALELFKNMPQRDVVSWTAMITGYAQDGQVDAAFELFKQMPDRDVASWNAMVAGYIQNGHSEEAQKIFIEMPEHDFISWSVMIAGFAQNGYFEESLKLFQKLQLTGVKPNTVILASLLTACASLSALARGKEVHEDTLRSGYHFDISVGNALIDMYTKCGSIDNAQKVFHKMPTRNVISWTAMIMSYAMNGCGKQALQIFEQMQRSGINPNHVTFIGILLACCHSGLVDDGWQYFNSMSQNYHITPAKEHYCCMVDLLGRAGHLDEAYDFVNKMPIKPDPTIWMSLLSACRIHSNINLGEHVVQNLLELDPKNSAPYVLLSNIYAAAGRWDDTLNVRKTMNHCGAERKPGCSWIEVNKQVYGFRVGD